MAEGGFKSKLSPATANDFLITTNLTLGLWKWVDVYADFGIVKNQGAPSEFLHGSGIRLNFLPDYLEIFFPLYSSNGWEINDIPYESKIRFIVSLNPDKLFQLFSRKWFWFTSIIPESLGKISQIKILYFWNPKKDENPRTEYHTELWGL